MRLSVLAGSIAVCLAVALPVLAQETTLPPDNPAVSLRLDSSVVEKGYTISEFDGRLKVILGPQVLAQETAVDLKKVEAQDIPWRLELSSDVFQYEFSNKGALDAKKLFLIQLSTTSATPYLKQIFMYDAVLRTWRPLSPVSGPDSTSVRASISLPSAHVAVFSYPDILATGDASWYAHKKGDFAASPDFPAGSRLRVHNTENGKYVDVTINDFGPDRSRFPRRVVDLEKRAFSKIASLGDGIISVRIEPLEIKPADGLKLGIPSEGIGSQPRIAAKAAIVLNEKGSVLFEKNADEALPIASLTKLIAVRVFLNTAPSMNAVVTYRTKDEKLNYQYVDNPWEVARLKVKDGETMTIQDLVYASLVGSANNTIESLVRVSGMTRAEFIKQMNSSAEEWGAVSTRFDDPTGLSSKNISSARDFALLAQEAFRHPIIQKASTARQYSFSTLNTKKKHTIRNTNRLVVASGLEITGSKTGFLYEAGYCLVTRIKAGSGSLIAIAFGDMSSVKNRAHITDLLRYGQHGSKRGDITARAITQKETLVLRYP